LRPFEDGATARIPLGARNQVLESGAGRGTGTLDLERAGVPRSAAMKMVGHKTETIYRRYAIANETMLREGAAKLEALLQAPQPSPSA
jgi:hypothetical protein